MTKNKIIYSGFFTALVAEIFLIFIIYLNPNKIEPIYNPSIQMWVNAALNFLSAVTLVIAFKFVKHKKIAQHKVFIHIALFFSALFLINYIFYHMSVGHVSFTNESYKTMYLIILASHLLTSFIGLPLIFITYLLGIFSHLKAHKQLAKFTFIIWEYVSITGVLVVLMLKFMNK